jgi:hypothetical protein
MKRVALLLLLSISACHSGTKGGSVSNPEYKELQKEEIFNDVEPTVAESRKAQLTAVTIQSRDELPARKTKVKLNGEIFNAESRNLYKGARVFNVLMSEFGLLKGTFVVVTRADTAECNLEHYQSKLIAKNTFRLTPIATDSSLVYLYQQLKKEGRFSVVEIEVDYSKQKPTPSSY